MKPYEVMLSTSDNPFNPFDDFENWLAFDREKDYKSCELLARNAIISDEMSQFEIDDEVERAIDEIIKYDPLDIYIKVTRQRKE